MFARRKTYVVGAHDEHPQHISYGELTKIIFQLSSNKYLICSSVYDNIKTGFLHWSHLLHVVELIEFSLR